jgi:hypothetical protein
MKQKSKIRKRKFTTATKKKKMVMNAQCMTRSHLSGQAFDQYSLTGLGKKAKGSGSF